MTGAGLLRRLRGADVDRRRVQVFTPSTLLMILGAQYIVGSVLVAVWLLLPDAPAEGRSQVAAMGVVAGLLGVGLCALAKRLARFAWLPHLVIASAQVVIGVAAGSGPLPGDPLLLFFIWTTLYTAVFTRRATMLHTAWTGVVLVMTMALGSGGSPGRAAGVLLIAFTTVLVVTLMVDAMSGRLHHDALHDPLTGLPNKTLFESATHAALQRAAARGSSVMVIWVDVDRFKNVNDSLGHSAGDDVLRQIAGRLTGAFGRRALIARLGGDEFVVLFESWDVPSDVVAVEERLGSLWAQPVVVGDGNRLHMTGSGGIAVARRSDDTAASLLRDADAAMYEAKAQGLSRCVVYDDGMRAASLRRIRLEHDLRDAISRDEIRVVYQPVVELATGAALGAEALLRWTHPQLGEVSPAEFIPVSEECGLIGTLGEWVLERAVSDLAGWRATEAVPDGFQMAVNISTRQLDPCLVSRVAATLHRHGVPATALGLEITEGALMAPQVAGPVLEGLHGLGVTLLLDDFGTGFSSLSHLQQFPFDVLKIDRSFVSRLGTSARDSSLVSAILSMSQALQLHVIAEGVETQQQATVLQAAGCCAAQGYLFARPLPAEELPAAVARRAPALAGAV